VLQGPTGSGKTPILEALERQGEQVIDLEGLANHKGSAFGGLGMPNQPATQQFQNDLAAELDQMDRAKRIWIESESMSIGKVYLPENLWQQMNLSRRIALEQPRDWRLDRIVQQYGEFNVDALIEKVEKLEQRLGNQNVTKAVEHLRVGEIREAADILLFYYDKSYAFSAEKYKHTQPAVVSLASADEDACAVSLINFADANKLN
jgi:tRNA 2-selenouridine synthase